MSGIPRYKHLCWLAGALASGAWMACAATPRPSTQAAPSGTDRAKTNQPSGTPAGKSETRKDNVVDDYFGVKVSDPYRWLENSDSPEVERWVDAQNRRTRHVLDATGLVPALRQRIGELLEIGSLSLPAVRRGSNRQLLLFYTKRQGRQNQPLLLWRQGIHGRDRVILDLNRKNPEGTTALDYFSPSPHGNLVAYGLSQNGSEESILYVRDVESGKKLSEFIPRTRSASVCWHADGSGFFYTRYPAPGSVPAGEERYHRTVYEHRLGDDPADDALVFGRDREMTDYPSCSISPAGRWLVVSVHVGWNRTDLFLADTTQRPLKFVELTQRTENTYGVLVHDDAIWIRTNEGAPRYAVYRATPRAALRAQWSLVLPEHETDVLETFNVLGSTIVAAYSRSAVSRLERFGLDGHSLGEVPLPNIGSVDDISGVHDEPKAFFDFESFATPKQVHLLELPSGTPQPLLTVSTPIDPTAFRVVRRTARSKDGTRVPYTLVSKMNVPLESADTPTLLYGYGGFNISLSPRFSRTNLAFVEQGGLYVQANLRGGGELGESWHRAGQLGNKQNVFDDFYAVAESLIATRVTRSDKLAIYGRSNGGLLVAAAITQRPELFRAAVCAVPLTDMLRYPRFLIGRLWTAEYGSPEAQEAFHWLYAYSPYHHIHPRTPYPATLFMTAESDTRVDPAHARKMAARLQANTSSAQPILLRTEQKAGHGAGKPLTKVADEHADLYAFVMSQLAMKPVPLTGHGRVTHQRSGQ